MTASIDNIWPILEDANLAICHLLHGGFGGILVRTGRKELPCRDNIGLIIIPPDRFIDS